MDAIDIRRRFYERTLWDDSTMLGLALKYITRQDNDEPFWDFLEDQANAEGNLFAEEYEEES